MLPVAGVPMIERVLGHLAEAGVTEAVLSLGYKPDAFLAAFPAGACRGVRLVYAVEPTPLDTAGGIAFAARAAGVDDTFLAVNGDVLTSFAAARLVEFHRRSGGEATIHLTPVEDPSAFGVVPTDRDGRVQAFVEKPAPGTAPTNYVNAGTYVLEPSVLARVADGARVSMERDVFPALVTAGGLFALGSDDYWIDTGTPAKYLAANLDALGFGAPPVPSARDDGNGVWVIDGARIDGKVSGPALVCEGAVVEQGAVVDHAVIGTGAHVNAGATVRDAVLLPGSVVGQGELVERAIVAADGTLVPA
jgi:mannose-1-phosphate guanylyltransferase